MSTFFEFLPNDLDVPIAVRKGVRSCTNHPMSKIVLYNSLSPSFSAFNSQLSIVEIPKNIQDALRVPEWKEAVFEEMRALEKNGTWEIVNLPKGKTIVGCKWVFTVKFKSSGTLERYEARLVAKGFTQTYRIDCTGTFVSVAKINTVRVLLSIVANLDWPLQQLDAKNAFLNGDLEEKFGSRVCRLQKSLYGLK